MRMTDDDRRNYPVLTRYIKFRMPEVVNVPLIVNNARRFGNLSRAQFRHALQWGTDPLVVVTELSNFQCGVQWANGCFVHARPSQIELDLTLSNDFENNPYGPGSIDRTSTGRQVFIIGTTILHELCHWGNFQAGVGEADEQGVAFEVATYGRNIG